MSLVKIELAREASTLITIWAVSQTARNRLGAFVLAFGVWDLTFYLWLRVADRLAAIAVHLGCFVPAAGAVGRAGARARDCGRDNDSLRRMDTGAGAAGPRASEDSSPACAPAYRGRRGDPDLVPVGLEALAFRAGRP